MADCGRRRPTRLRRPQPLPWAPPSPREILGGRMSRRTWSSRTGWSSGSTPATLKPCRPTRRMTSRSCRCAPDRRSTGARKRRRPLRPTATRAGRSFGLTPRRFVTRATGRSDWAVVGACARNGAEVTARLAMLFEFSGAPPRKPEATRTWGGPRSRRAVGVGDVAGERGGRATDPRAGLIDGDPARFSDAFAGSTVVWPRPISRWPRERPVPQPRGLHLLLP